MEGEPIYNGHSRAPESRFIVGIGVPASIIQNPLYRSLWDILIGGCAVGGLGALVAVFISGRLAKGLRRVAAAAEQVPMGRCEVPRTSRVAEIDQITAALATSAQVILERTRQRDQADRVMRQTAEDLKQLNQTLEERIAIEIADRHQAEAALHQAQKMEAIGQLTGGVARDFNNLLQVISGNLEALCIHFSKVAEGMGEGGSLRYIDVAMRAAQRGASLTERLLAFSRQQPLMPVDCDPNELVSGMSELIRSTIGETISMKTILENGVWQIFVDRNQLESAVLNLAVNARDAMPRGGELVIQTDKARLGEQDKGSDKILPGEYVVITVKDTGKGMTTEVRQRVFEPFFTTKPVGQGSGLGLSQVYGFVKQSNGYVKISSRLGLGTIVSIYLPRDCERQTSNL